MDIAYGHILEDTSEKMSFSSLAMSLILISQLFTVFFLHILQRKLLWSLAVDGYMTYRDLTRSGLRECQCYGGFLGSTKDDGVGYLRTGEKTKRSNKDGKIYSYFIAIIYFKWSQKSVIRSLTPVLFKLKYNSHIVKFTQ